MDIADFIKELLAQQGELSVPGLGYFVQTRKGAYYDEASKTFYPPHHEVEFDPQSIDDDDALANYITERKNISLASSKYFLDKYIDNLKEQALLQDVPFADFGWISADPSGIQFKSKATVSESDPAFFGYQPLNLMETAPPAPVKRPEPVVTNNRVAPPIGGPVNEEPVSYSSSLYHHPPSAKEEDDHFPHVYNLKTGLPEEDAYIDEEIIESRRSYRPWIILMAVLCFLAIGAVLAKKYRPDLFNRLLFTGRKDSTAKLPTQVISHDAIALPGKEDLGKAPGDTSKKSTIIAKPVVAALPDSIPKGSWIIVTTPIETRPLADDMLDNFVRSGQTQVRFMEHIKITDPYVILLGIYKTEKEAQSAIIDMRADAGNAQIKLSIEQHK